MRGLFRWSRKWWPGLIPLAVLWGLAAWYETVPLEQEFHWSNAEISSALSIRLLLYGLVAPFAAALINRYGMRNVVVGALTTIISGLVLSLFMTEVWQLIVLWGFVVGLGTGMTALVLGATVATRSMP